MMFYLLIFLNFIHSEIIVLPFQKKNEFKGDLYSYFFLNELRTTISIGTPIQKIEAYIKPNKHHLFISGADVKGEYKEYRSKTFKKELPKERYFNGEPFKTGFLVNDTFDFLTENGKIIKIDCISFLLATKIDNRFDYIDSAQIGLGLYDTSTIKEQNLLYQLNYLNSIQSYAYYFQFENYDKGKIIIGEKPHDYVINFPDKIFNYFKIETHSNDYQITFDKVSIGNNEYFKISAQFNFSFGGFITNEKNQKIFDTFFNPLIDKSLCQKEKKDIFWFYSCNESVNISEIQSIKFYHKGFNETFELTYKDLFRKFKDKYYYMVIFQNQYRIEWIFGQIFFQKYKIIIDQNTKIMGLYKNIPIPKKNNNLYSWIFIFILTLIIFIMVFLLYRRIKLIPKKIKANELIDEEIKDDYLKILN